MAALDVRPITTRTLLDAPSALRPGAGPDVPSAALAVAAAAASGLSFVPMARQEGNAVSGVPILDVDHAKTGMCFADAKHGLAEPVVAIKQHVTA